MSIFDDVVEELKKAYDSGAIGKQELDIFVEGVESGSSTEAGVAGLSLANSVFRGHEKDFRTADTASKLVRDTVMPSLGNLNTLKPLVEIIKTFDKA